MVFHELQHVFLFNNLFLDTLLQIIVNKFGCDPFNRFFTGWIDFGENHFIQLAQGVRKIFVEVAGTSIEMWLEDSSDFLVLIEFPMLFALW